MTNTRDRHGGWPAVILVALGAFAVVTSEMLPVGLLTPISESLRISAGTTGLTVTVTGYIAAVASPLTASLLGRFDRRALLCALMLLLAIGNLGTAFAPNFAVLIIARVLVGVVIGGVWSIAASLPVRLVPAKAVAAASSVVFSGIGLAAVLGVPAGTLLGTIAGWRTGFYAIALLGLLVAGAMYACLPRLAAEPASISGGAWQLLRQPRPRTGLIAIALVVTAHFAVYTYIRPIVESRTDLPATVLSALLLGYGIAGIFGNFLGGLGANRSPKVTLLMLGGILAASLLALTEAAALPLIAGLLVLWGIGYGGVSVTGQTWLLASAPRARELASGLFVGVFNAAIASGALLGGAVADAAGTEPVLVLGIALAAAAVLVIAFGSAPKAGPDAQPTAERLSEC